MSGDEVYRSPVIFSVVIKGFVDIVYDFLWVAAQGHLCVPRSVGVPVVEVEVGYKVVDFVVDI